jgi:hypothetical protein
MAGAANRLLSWASYVDPSMVIVRRTRFDLSAQANPIFDVANPELVPELNHWKPKNHGRTI